MAGKPPKKAITKRSELSIPPSKHLPQGMRVRWSDVVDRYQEQIAGQGYTRSRVRADLAKKKKEFRHVQDLIRMYEETGNISEVARRVGKHKQSIHRILSKGKLPINISPERHKYHQRTRKQPRPDLASHSDVGYLIGLHTARPINLRRNEQTGLSRTALTTASKRYADRLQSTFQSVLGLDAGRANPFMRKGAKRPTHTVSLQSAELVNKFGDVISNSKHPWNSLPDSPEARRSFTQAVYDRGSSYFEDKSAIGLKHKDPEVLKLVSRSLKEQGVPHQRREYRGKDSIVVGRNGFSRFKEKIGFRDEEKHSRIPE